MLGLGTVDQKEIPRFPTLTDWCPGMQRAVERLVERPGGVLGSPATWNAAACHAHPLQGESPCSVRVFPLTIQGFPAAERTACCLELSHANESGIRERRSASGQSKLEAPALVRRMLGNSNRSWTRTEGTTQTKGPSHE